MGPYIWSWRHKKHCSYDAVTIKALLRCLKPSLCLMVDSNLPRFLLEGFILPLCGSRGASASPLIAFALLTRETCSWNSCALQGSWSADVLLQISLTRTASVVPKDISYVGNVWGHASLECDRHIGSDWPRNEETSECNFLIQKWPRGHFLRYLIVTCPSLLLEGCILINFHFPRENWT